MKTLKLLIGLVISIYLAAISFQIASLFEMNLYKNVLKSDNLEELVGLELSEVESDVEHLIRYTLFDEVSELDLNNFELSDESEYHFFEVKNIVKNIRLFNIYMSVPIICILITIFIKKKSGYLLSAVILSAFVLLFLGCVFFFYEDWAFEFFHRLIFNNEYWIFDPRIDPIIHVLPQKFFINSFYLILGIYMALNSLVFAVDRKIIQRVKEKSISL